MCSQRANGAAHPFFTFYFTTHSLARALARSLLRALSLTLHSLSREFVRQVLGHGKGYFSHAPSRVERLGFRSDRPVVALAAGANHALVIARASEAAGAARLYPLLRFALEQPSAAAASGAGNAGSQGGASGLSAAQPPAHADEEDPWAAGCDLKLVVGRRVFPCHRVIVSARSAYLRGHLAAAEKEVGGCRPAASRAGPSLTLELESLHASEASVAALLVRWNMLLSLLLTGALVAVGAVLRVFEGLASLYSILTGVPLLRPPRMPAPPPHLGGRPCRRAISAPPRSPRPGRLGAPIRKQQQQQQQQQRRALALGPRLDL